MAQTAYIVDAVRTAGGRRNGRLSGVHPVRLGSAVLDAILDRTGVPGDRIEDVIVGCVSQVNEQSRQLGRFMTLASRLPESVPSVTIDRQCGSSQQAIQFAAQAVLSGTQDLVIAAGVESMSRVPLGSATRRDQGLSPMIPEIQARLGIEDFSQFRGAEMIAKKFGFSRDLLDAYGLESHRRAIAATRSGAFDQELVPIDIERSDGSLEAHSVDEGIRWDASQEGMANVKPLTEDKLLTAATSSQITDGAAAVLVASERAVREFGLEPLARIDSFIVTAGDPVVMLEEPLFATERLLKKTGRTMAEMDLYEVNEAFAPIPLAWLRHLDADPEKMNAFGGAIALGHPLGASGAKLMATLVHGLRRKRARFGLQTMCEGGGLANVMIVEAC